MGRPSKSARVLHECSQTKEELNKRIMVEDKLKGLGEVKPSNRLNSNQKKIFSFIVSHLEASGILGSIDTFLLETAAIAINRLQDIEKEINRDFTMIYNRELMTAKEKYTKDFFKCCQELSLSPQSRAKFGILALNQEKEEIDPLLKILKGGKGN